MPVGSFGPAAVVGMACCHKVPLWKRGGSKGQAPALLLPQASPTGAGTRLLAAGQHVHSHVCLTPERCMRPVLAQNRGAPILAEYLGGAITCDAYHMTDPRADGLGVSTCIELAIKDAGIEREQARNIFAVPFPIHCRV